MARLARVKAEGDGAFYHLCGRVAGVIGEYPLDDKRCRRKIIDFIRLFAKVYCCQVLGFCIMGNHLQSNSKITGMPCQVLRLISRLSKRG